MTNNIKNLIPIPKGQTRNPNGRPKGSLSWNTLINKLIDGKITIEEAGAAKKIRKKDLMVLELIRIALDRRCKPSDRLKAMEIIFDRTEGKPTQKIEQANLNLDITKEDLELKLLEIANQEGITIEQLKEREGIE